MWTRDGSYLYHSSGRLRISKWDICSGARYHVQKLIGGVWREQVKPAPLTADEAKEIAEGLTNG